MVKRMRFGSAVGSTVVIAALAVVGCGGSDSKPEKKTSSPKAQAKVVAGGTVVIKPNGKTVVKIKSSGIAVGATRGSKRAGNDISMAATGGELVSATAIGFVRTGGGIVFQRGKAQVPFTDIAVSTRKRTVTATNGGKRVTLFQLRVANITRKSTSTGGIRATGLGVSLTGKAAALINRGLAVNTFSKKQPFGTVAITVSLKKKSTAKKPAATAKPGTTTKSSGQGNGASTSKTTKPATPATTTSK